MSIQINVPYIIMFASDVSILLINVELMWNGKATSPHSAHPTS